MKTVADAGNSGVVEKAYYRRHWRIIAAGATVVGATAGAIAIIAVGAGVITTATIVTGATIATGAKRHRCRLLQARRMIRGGRASQPRPL